MLAYAYKEYGTPDVLAQIEVPTPTPKPNEVLIRASVRDFARVPAGAITP